MTQIHVVTHGEYSDYSIVAVFSADRQDDALAFAALIDGSVEVFDLNPTVPADPGQDYYTIEITKDGKLTDRSRQEPNRLGSEGELRRRYCWFRTHKDCTYERKSFWRLTWYGYADSFEHAVKIVNEIRSQILAGQCPAGVDMGKNTPTSQTEEVR